MKCGARIAMGVAGGYFLGRTKKMKLALMMGGWAAGRQMGGPGQILGQASKLLGQSPELTALTDQVRGRLLEAGKEAAMAVATRRMEALTDRVGRRVEDLAEVRRVPDRDIGRGADLDDRDVESEDDYEDVEDAEEEAPPPVSTRRARTSETGTARTQPAKKGAKKAATSSARTPKKAGASRRASRTARTHREGSDG